MKIFLRLKRKPLAVGDQLSDTASYIQAILMVKPKVYQLSSVGDQPSELSCQLSAMSYQQSALKLWQLIKRWALDKVRPLRFLQFILVFFVSCSAALAQEHVVHTAPAAQADAGFNKVAGTEITPLKIGDKIPDELWEMHFPVVSAKSDHVQYLSLGDFRDKLIILDFWATWCAPCVSSLHKLDTLQEQFKDDLMVIPTSYEQESKVRPFLTNRMIDLQSLIDEEDLKKYFPHTSIPHQVWIKEGKVKAITSGEFSNWENVSNAINGVFSDMSIKEENLNFDYTVPLLVGGNGVGAEKLLYQSSITERLNVGVGGQFFFDNGITVMNQTVKDLFLLAYSFEIPFSGRRNRIIFDVPDSLLNRINLPNELKQRKSNKEIIEFETWKNENTYCYNLVLPKKIDLPENFTNSVMVNDLNRYFSMALGVVGKLEKRSVACWVLKVIDKEQVEKYYSKEGKSEIITEDNRMILKNRSIEQLARHLSSKLWRLDKPIVADDTHFNHIDIALNLDFDNINAVRTMLSQYGLDLVEEQREITMLVFSKI